MICSNCKRPVEVENAKFCTYCGAVLSGGDNSSAPQQAPAADAPDINGGRVDEAAAPSVYTGYTERAETDATPAGVSSSAPEGNVNTDVLGYAAGKDAGGDQFNTDTTAVLTPDSYGQTNAPQVPPYANGQEIPPYAPPTVNGQEMPPYAPPTANGQEMPPYAPPTVNGQEMPPYAPPAANGQEMQTQTVGASEKPKTGRTRFVVKRRRNPAAVVFSVILSILLTAAIAAAFCLTVIHASFGGDAISDLIEKTSLTSLKVSMSDRGDDLTDNVRDILKNQPGFENITDEQIAELIEKPFIKRYLSGTLEDCMAYLMEGVSFKGITSDEVIDLISKNEKEILAVLTGESDKDDGKDGKEDDDDETEAVDTGDVTGEDAGYEEPYAEEGGDESEGAEDGDTDKEGGEENTAPEISIDYDLLKTELDGFLEDGFSSDTIDEMVPGISLIRQLLSTPILFAAWGAVAVIAVLLVLLNLKTASDILVYCGIPLDIIGLLMVTASFAAEIILSAKNSSLVYLIYQLASDKIFIIGIAAVGAAILMFIAKRMINWIICRRFLKAASVNGNEA